MRAIGLFSLVLTAMATTAYAASPTESLRDAAQGTPPAVVSFMPEAGAGPLGPFDGVLLRQLGEGPFSSEPSRLKATSVPRLIPRLLTRSAANSHAVRERVACGMVVVLVDPSLDPGMLRLVPGGDGYFIRVIPPSACATETWR
jgi:hypothetical protein